MKHAVLAAIAATLVLSVTSGSNSEPCSAGTISMDVATTSDLELMRNILNCTGEGIYNITWVGSVPLEETIEVCENKRLTVTGSTSTGSTSTGSASALTDLPSAVIDAGGTTGIFKVCNGSTLSLNHLVLEGGTSEYGAAVDASSFSSVYVADCAFTNNKAASGGETRRSVNIPVYIFRIMLRTNHASSEKRSSHYE